MTKPKNPLFSLEAHGTVGDALTYQHRSGVDFVRRKPTPTDPMSNAQMYHRWDYLDYAYLWRQLSTAEKAAWRVIGTRTRISGFNAFMSDRLLTLPDLVSRWRMDYGEDASILDTSKNSNTGICTGTSPASGILAGCKRLDGIDDFITIPNDTSLDVTTEFTIMCWFYRIALSASVSAILRRDAVDAYAISQAANSLNLRGRFLPTVGGSQYSGWLAVPNSQWHFLVLRYNHWTIELHIWGVASASLNIGPFTIRAGTGDMIIGRDDPVVGRYLNAYIDDLKIYNRALADAEIDRHMERRLPV